MIRYKEIRKKSTYVYYYSTSKGTNIKILLGDWYGSFYILLHSQRFSVFKIHYNKVLQLGLSIKAFWKINIFAGNKINRNLFIEFKVGIQKFRF